MIKRLRVTVDGNSYDVTVELPDEATSASPPLEAPAASAAPTPPAAAARATAPPLPAPSQAGPAAPGDVPSPLAGRVTAVVVTVGQEVKEDDHLVTLEAMKMNTFVFAPQKGRITEIKVSVGSTVEEGHPLVRIG